MAPSLQRTLAVRRSHPRVRLQPGEYDDLDRLNAVDAGHPIAHRRRDLIGLLALLGILALLVGTCIHPPRASVEPGHVVPLTGP